MDVDVLLSSDPLFAYARETNAVDASIRVDNDHVKHESTLTRLRCRLPSIGRLCHFDESVRLHIMHPIDLSVLHAAYLSYRTRREYARRIGRASHRRCNTRIHRSMCRSSSTLDLVDCILLNIDIMRRRCIVRVRRYRYAHCRLDTDNS